LSTAIPDTRFQLEERVVPLAGSHLRALDGIRFLAAFCVVVGHGYWYVVLQQQSGLISSTVANAVMGLPSLGMTLFFVLSGFVIHYNYHHSVGIGRHGNFDFLIARFSRLYPLFFVVFMVDFIHLLALQGYLTGAPHFDIDLFGPLPFFLSFTQAWWFIPFDGTALYDHYTRLSSHAQATGLMWSLSVECLLYLSYPIFSAWLSRRRGWSLATLAIVIATTGTLYFAWAGFCHHAISASGTAEFGTHALGEQFFGWVSFYSPLGRMTEFAMGAAGAQYYLSSGGRSRFSAKLPGLSGAVLAVAIAVWTSSIRVSGFNVSVIGPLVACFVLLAVFRQTWISQLFSKPLLVKCGEASYSLYLLHFYTIHELAAPNSVELETPGRVVVLIVGVVISAILARGFYLWFERPALRWLRANFKPLRLHIALGVVFLATTLLCIIASMQFHAVAHASP
jgi:peptidoglycan/LPS O-acetylase OafA/YrhL